MKMNIAKKLKHDATLCVRVYIHEPWDPSLEGVPPSLPPSLLYETLNMRVL